MGCFSLLNVLGAELPQGCSRATLIVSSPPFKSTEGSIAQAAFGKKCRKFVRPGETGFIYFWSRQETKQSASAGKHAQLSNKAALTLLQNGWRWGRRENERLAVITGCIANTEVWNKNVTQQLDNGFPVNLSKTCRKISLRAQRITVKKVWDFWAAKQIR